MSKFKTGMDIYEGIMNKVDESGDIIPELDILFKQEYISKEDLYKILDLHSFGKMLKQKLEGD